MEYVVQAFKVLKNLVHADQANARAQKTGFLSLSLPKHDFFAGVPINFMHVWIFALLEHEICKLIPKGRSVIITDAPLGISFQFSCSNNAYINILIYIYMIACTAYSIF